MYLYTNLFTYLYTTKLYFNKDSDDVIVSCREMGILGMDLNNINLDDINYVEFFLSDFRLSISNLKNVKLLKKT